MIDVQSIPSGQLVQQFRDTVLAIGRDDPANPSRNRDADQMEEEILRRMAW